MSDHEGIDGLDGREPVGAALTIGVKHGAKGFPTETDRFHIVAPREEDGRRPHLAAFAQFNSADPDKRKLIRGNLVHARRAECFEHHLKAQTGPKKLGMHPQRRPFCVGDGLRATRWMGDGDNFSDIKCPHDKCEYRLTEPASCKPWARLLFQLRWPDGNPLPTPLVKLTTGSWNTVRNLVGFFDHVEGAAGQLGLDDYSLWGMPFTLTLTRQTNAQKKRSFPVIAVSPDMAPVEFFASQRETLRALSSPTPYVALEHEREPAVVAGDHDAISVPGGRA